MSSPSPIATAETRSTYHVLIWTGVLVLALIQVFVSFRGLDSAAGMDQAQIARELARGNGFSTRFIRPMALQQATSAGKQPNFSLLPDTSQPPVQPLLWAPAFKAMQSKWSFEDKKRIYPLDRVIACFGVTWLLISLVLIHGIAKRLFDLNIAAFTVLTLALCHPLWQMAVGGSSRALLMLLVVLFFHRFQEALRRDHTGERIGAALVFQLIVLGGIIALTHWMGVWLVAGLVVAWWFCLPSSRAGAYVLLVLLIGCISGWGARNLMVGGDPMGMFKANLLSILTPLPAAVHLRDLSGTLPSAFFGTLINRINHNFADLLSNLYLLLMGSLPAMLAVVSLVHRFRNPVVNSMRNAVFITWAAVIVGSVILGGQTDIIGDEQIHTALVPLLTAFGLATLAVLWARLRTDRRTLWTDFGYAFVIVFISAWPMASGLYYGIVEGLFAKDKLINWPPYMPDATGLLNKLVNEDELVVTDQPWAVAWYADRTAIWLPKTKEQFQVLKKEAAAQQHPIVGMLLSPMSTLDEHVHTAFTGNYAPWADVILRSPVLGLGVDLGENMKDAQLFRRPIPLGGMTLPDGRLVPLLTYFSDEDRSARISPPSAKKNSGK